MTLEFYLGDFYRSLRLMNLCFALVYSSFALADPPRVNDKEHSFELVGPPLNSMKDFEDHKSRANLVQAPLDHDTNRQNADQGIGHFIKEIPKSKGSRHVESQGSKTSSLLPPALKLVNQRFHEALKEPVLSERSKLGPAIFFEHNQLKLVRDGQVVAEESAAPTALYHQVKAFSHMCMTAGIKLWTLRGQEKQSLWAKKYLQEVIAAQDSVQSLNQPTPIAARQIALSAITSALLEEALVQEISFTRLKSYLQDIKPLILENFKIAARDHINQLDHAFDRLKERLSKEDRAHLYAFTYGPRGPRGDNLITQYLAFLVGQDQLIEGERVLYAEGLSSAKETFDLVAKYNIEQALGVMFFNDSMALQRDVLADSARHILRNRPRSKLSESPSSRLLKEFGFLVGD